MCVLTKIESLDSSELSEKMAIVSKYGYNKPMCISVHQEIGLLELQTEMLTQLFGKPRDLKVIFDEANRGVEGFVSDVYESSMVITKTTQKNGNISMRVWISEQSLARLISNSKGRIEVK